MVAEVETVLKEMTRRLVAEFQPHRISLSGSYAWGQPNEESDVDLLVVVSDSDRSPLERGLQARRCLCDVKMPKDVLAQTRAEVDWASRVYASLEAEILERGVRLYDGLSTAL